jgi:hypothetical protein
MSQFPPGGPPNYPPQPPGFGMPGQPGYNPQGYSLPAATKTSVASVISLVSGLLFCIPGLTGVIALITGIIGIAQTGNPAVKGRGMAIAGLILGILSLGGWGLFGGGMYAMYVGAKPQRDFARTYITDLAAGKVDQCVANSSANISPDMLGAEAKRMQGWGALQDTRIIGFAINNTNGNIAGQVTGICTFSNGTHSFQMTLIKDSSGSFKADTFLWQN